MHKALVVVIFLALAIAAPVSAQTPVTGANKIGWDQGAPTLADAQAYTYKYYADASVIGITLASVVCTGTVSPYQCEVPFPAFTPGSHTLTLTAGNLAGESVKSAPLGFAFVVTPGAPVNLKIK